MVQDVHNLGKYTITSQKALSACFLVKRPKRECFLELPHCVFDMLSLSLK